MKPFAPPHPLPLPPGEREFNLGIVKKVPSPLMGEGEGGKTIFQVIRHAQGAPRMMKMIAKNESY
jgi:hypothetical protein